MKREAATNRAAGTLRARDKLFEYSPKDVAPLPLPLDFNPSRLFPLAIGFLGDFAAEKVSSFIGVEDYTKTDTKDVSFSAKTFLAYANSRIDQSFRNELVLLSSSAFHLVDMPGVSLVQATRLSKSYDKADSLERLLIWSLIQPWMHEPPGSGDHLDVANLSRVLFRHYRLGVSRSEMVEVLVRLRQSSYAFYDDRALLLAEIFSAISISRFESSSRLLLHRFSRTTVDSWTNYLSADSAVHELWPSQRKLGEAGVFSGSSAIVQMPTSAGKTKATELILRTAFASDRARLAVIVAPFVALCDEIHDELQRALAIDRVRVNRLGDALQADYAKIFLEPSEDDESSLDPHVVVMTPEKLLYVLRQRPEMATYVDLVIYDEGHQFDSGPRGVTYELLLTSIKGRLKRTSQTVLISAVIQNAKVVSDWLLGSKSSVVVDTSNQTQRSIGFTSQHSGGQIHFIPNSESEPAFVVPGVMVREQLARRGREKSPRYFPDNDSKSVALYLGLRLFSNGGVAVFCGKKDSASALIDHALDVFSRDPSMSPPLASSDQEEVGRLENLFALNFGQDCYLTKGASLGLFAHTSGTPRGLRLAIEHAMRKRSICFVVCTSTLAQGVNLPIKYLLVTGTHQGREPIRIRDFKNLMGRAGRAGMHEEGAVIFCDTRLIDDRSSAAAVRRWNIAGQLINPESQDPVGSSLLSLVLPFKDRFGDFIAELPQVDIDVYLLGAPGRVETLVEELSSRFSKLKLDEASLRSQLTSRIELLKRLQSHIMASAVDVGVGDRIDAASLAKETLAYHLATDEQKANLVRLFEEVSGEVSDVVPETEKQVRFGKSLLGVQASLLVDQWVKEELEGLLECSDTLSLASKLWSLFLRVSEPQKLRQCDPPEALEAMFHAWLGGASYVSLFDTMTGSNAMHPRGERMRQYDIDDIIALCEDFFGFEVPLLVAAVRTALSAHGSGWPKTKRVSYLADVLQKQIKYGLPNQNCVAIFEAGFSDRVVAQRIEQKIWGRLNSPDSVELAIRDWQADVEDVLDEFPGYFRSVFRSIAIQSES